MAHDSSGRFCKEEAPRPHPRLSSLVLSTAPAKRVKLRGDEEEPSQCAAPMHLPRCSMEEVGSSSARGRKPYKRAWAKLADSSDVRHGEAGFFSSMRRKKRSTRIEVSADSSSDDSSRRVVLVDLISSGDDTGNNSGDNFKDHEESSEAITHEICPWTITSSLINCSKASISICCRKLLHMTLTGFGLKSTSSRNRLKRSRQDLQPVRAKTAFL
jgi:hypothetical protein